MFMHHTFSGVAPVCCHDEHKHHVKLIPSYAAVINKLPVFGLSSGSWRRRTGSTATWLCCSRSLRLLLVPRLTSPSSRPSWGVSWTGTKKTPTAKTTSPRRIQVCSLITELFFLAWRETFSVLCLSSWVLWSVSSRTVITRRAYHCVLACSGSRQQSKSVDLTSIQEKRSTKWPQRADVYLKNK